MVRQFSRKLLNLAQMKNSDCEATLLDAERFKRNLLYIICVICRTFNLEAMENAIRSVLEYHFNNHTLCGGWCKVK
jgi:hypothetical protein